MRSKACSKAVDRKKESRLLGTSNQTLKLASTATAIFLGSCSPQLSETSNNQDLCYYQLTIDEEDYRQLFHRLHEIHIKLVDRFRSYDFEIFPLNFDEKFFFQDYCNPHYLLKDLGEFNIRYELGVISKDRHSDIERNLYCDDFGCVE
jgi:hypothetical protein